MCAQDSCLLMLKVTSAFKPSQAFLKMASKDRKEEISSHGLQAGNRYHCLQRARAQSAEEKGLCPREKAVLSV